MRTALALILAASVIAGCGTETSDLLVVDRSGKLPDAKVTMLITDGLIVECDGKEEPLPNDLLLDARDLAKRLLPVLDKNPKLPIPSNALLRFRVEGETGTATFAEASPNLPPELAELVLLTRRIAKASCGLAR